jgi:uncharacterized membrane protein YphA (DoxX/SURF4 family)
MRAEPVAAFRVAAAVAIACHVVFGIAPDLPPFFTDDGLIPGELADRVLAHTGRFSLKRAFGGVLDTALGSWCVLFALLGALGLLAAGIRARIAAGVAYLLLASFTQRSLTLTNGGDDLAVHALFYLMLVPSTRGVTHVAPWAVRLAQIQLCLIYFYTGISKLDANGPSDWLTGEAVYWALNDITLTRFSYAAFPVPLWICRVLSWATLVFEIGFPVLILLPRVRPWLLVVGVGLHTSIALTMHVGFFSPNILVYYGLFVSPEALTRARAAVESLLAPAGLATLTRRRASSPSARCSG